MEATLASVNLATRGMVSYARMMTSARRGHTTAMLMQHAATPLAHSDAAATKGSLGAEIYVKVQALKDLH